MEDVFGTVSEAVEKIVELLDDPSIAERWEEPSALPGLSVGGLTAHLLMGAAYMHRLLDGPDGVTGPVVSVAEYTARMKMDDFDADLHRYIRDQNERSATHGPEPTTARLRALLSALRDRLRTESGGRLLDMRPTFPWVMSLEDRLRLMVMDLVVHLDDLAVSIGRPGCEATEAASSMAIEAMLAAARLQHGDRAVIRALARRERSTPGVFPVL
jgi:uncharacterized protein (TIGR03083 family)